MSKYTTGELARLCGVSVRTVQYYDDRGILIPSTVSDGGRRLYSDNDLKRLRVICFLREAGISINGIAMLFEDSDPHKVISLLIDEQEAILNDELSKCKEKLELVSSIKRELKDFESFSVDSISDIAYTVNQKNKIKKMRLGMVFSGIPVTLLQCTSIVLWITSGIWWLFLIWLGVAVPWGIIVSRYYFKHTAFICPECHTVFKPKIRESFWAYHTPRMRRLKCRCGRYGLCLEVYSDGDDIHSEK